MNNALPTLRNLKYRNLISAFCLVLAMRFAAASAYRAAISPGGLFSIDFSAYYAAAKRVNEGQPMYVRENNGLTFQHASSPLVPWLVRPLARRSLADATRGWAAVSVGLLSLAIVCFWWGSGMRVLEDPGPALLVLLTGFRFWPTTIELGIGNTDMILLVIGCAMFVCSRYRQWVLFAALVALAALTKTWMIGTVFYLLVRRRWWEAVAAFGFFLAGLVLMFSWLGWSEWPVFLHVTRDYSFQPLVSNSVAGMARLYFTHSAVMPPLFESHACWAAAVFTGYGCLIGGLCYLWFRGPRLSEPQSRLALGLVFMALILGSPISHQYYFVLALPALWTLMLESPSLPRGRTVLMGAFVLYLVLSVPTPSLNPVPEGYRHGFKALLVGTSFLCGISIWIFGLFGVTPGVPEEESELEEEPLRTQVNGHHPFPAPGHGAARTLIVIPTYNEAEALPFLLPRLAKAVPDAHLLLVDDGSPDGTAAMAESLFGSTADYANYAVLRRTGPRGLGVAYRDGFQWALNAGYDRVVQMDADLSHDPNDLPQMLNAAERADLVIGSRYCQGGKLRDWAPRRVLLSQFAGRYVRAILGLPFTDPTAGFRCWTRQALERVKLSTLDSEGYAFQVEMALRAAQAGLAVVEVPITFTDRTQGKSKISRAVLLESMVLPWKLRLSGRFDRREEESTQSRLIPSKP